MVSKVKAQKIKKVMNGRPQPGPWPSPLGTQLEDIKGAQVLKISSWPHDLEENLPFCLAFPKAFCPTPLSGHPSLWAPLAKQPCLCHTPTPYPVPEKPHYRTGSSRCQPSPISSESQGEGETPSAGRA